VPEESGGVFMPADEYLLDGSIPIKPRSKSLTITALPITLEFRARRNSSTNFVKDKKISRPLQHDTRRLFDRELASPVATIDEQLLV
jgi:hypothetical protein